MSVFLLVTLAAWGHLCALSPPPPPTPTESAKEEQHASPSEHSDTNASQQAVAGPTKKAKNTETQSSDSGDKSPTDWWIAAFTGILTLVGIIQLIAMFRQGSFMKQGLSVSIEAARAAQYSSLLAKEAVELNERATYLTQRAVILIESMEALPPPGVTSGGHLHTATVLVFALKNYGATVAHNVKVKGEITCLSKGLKLNGAQGITMAPQGANRWITYSLGSILRGDQIEELNNSTNPNSLTYRVEVTYDDVFAKSHSYVVDGQYIALLKGFITGNSTSD